MTSLFSFATNELHKAILNSEKAIPSQLVFDKVRIAFSYKNVVKNLAFYKKYIKK